MDWNEDRVKVGKNVRVQEGAVLGAEPLKLEIRDGRRQRMECKGDLIIEDYVDIGAGAVLNLGWEKDTIIREGVFIGHLSSVGHDAEIGPHSVISAHVCVCGCAKIGEWCYIAPQSVVKPGVKVGDYTMIGMGSIVDKDLPEGVIAYNKIIETCRPRRLNEWRPPI